MFLLLEIKNPTKKKTLTELCSKSLKGMSTQKYKFFFNNVKSGIENEFAIRFAKFDLF